MSAETQLPFPETGEINETTAAEIVRHALSNPVTTCLIAQDGKRKKALYIRDGRAVGAKSNQPEETLIRLAKKLKVLDESIFNEITLKLNSGDATPQGALMAEHGVSEQKIDALLVRQTATRFADLCTWRAGRYRLKAELPEQIPGNPADAIAIFVEFGKMSFKPDQFRSVMAPFADAPVKILSAGATHHKEALTSGDARELMKRASAGPCTATELFGDIHSGGKVMNAWLIGFALKELGVIELTPAAEAVPPPHTPPAAKADPAPAPTPQAKAKPKAKREKPNRATKPTPRAPMQSGKSRSPMGARDIDSERGRHPELEKRYDESVDKDYFEVLGIGRDADGRAVKKAYFKLAKEFHPDRFFDQESRAPSQMAEKLFSLINRAYEELREDDRREAYLAVLERGTTDEEEIKKAEDILASELEFQKAQILIRRKKFGEAVGHLKAALELYPEEPDYEIQLAWSRFMSAYPDKKNEYESATVDMKHHVAKGGRYSTAESWYLYGRMQKISGNSGGAIKAFEKVLELDRKNKDAARELRVLKGQ